MLCARVQVMRINERSPDGRILSLSRVGVYLVPASEAAIYDQRLLELGYTLRSALSPSGDPFSTLEEGEPNIGSFDDLLSRLGAAAASTMMEDAALLRELGYTDPDDIANLRHDKWFKAIKALYQRLSAIKDGWYGKQLRT